mmetsp:Transcript_41689/g.61208  ORF Transcript_41689/g.61208 Transcript_41689/m.61208 type:complete len:214 (+) Transcript_41689:587-1228(+)
MAYIEQKKDLGGPSSNNFVVIPASTPTIVRLIGVFGTIRPPPAATRTCLLLRVFLSSLIGIPAISVTSKISLPGSRSLLLLLTRKSIACSSRSNTIDDTVHRFTREKAIKQSNGRLDALLATTDNELRFMLLRIVMGTARRFLLLVVATGILVFFIIITHPFICVVVQILVSILIHGVDRHVRRDIISKRVWDNHLLSTDNGRCPFSNLTKSG